MERKKKKCKWCREWYEKQPEHRPFRNWCSDDCAISIARDRQQKQRERQAAKVKRDAGKETKANRKALRDLNRTKLGWQHTQTKKAFNRMRVLEELLWFKERGMEPTCISCAKPIGNDIWSCGHFKTVAAQGGLRYDRLNTYLQHSKSCNSSLSADLYGTKNTIGYVKGLAHRFGQKKAKEILDYLERSTKPVKWAWQDIEEMRADFNSRIRTLDKELSC